MGLQGKTFCEFNAKEALRAEQSSTLKAMHLDRHTWPCLETKKKAKFLEK